jgi:antitoxin YefM
MYIVPVHVVEDEVANRTTYTQARAKLASLCDRVAETREPYVIERRNGENVALISEAELNALLETAHLLRSPRNAARLAAALERARGGKPAPSTLEKLRQSLGLEDSKG